MFRAARWAAATMRPLRLRSSFCTTAKATTGSGKQPLPQFGKTIAGSETAAAQQLHAMGAGKFQYLNDFWKSLEKGPVKLRDTAAAPSAKDVVQNEAQARAVALMQRAMMIGTVIVFGGGAIGWWLTKKTLGVANVREFGDLMRKKFPKVSGEALDSPLGKKLQAVSESSRDNISESEKLAEWRRSMRGKFNTEEGAKLARENSILLAEMRARERVARKSSKEQSEKAVIATSGAAAAAEANVQQVAVPAQVGAEVAPHGQREHRVLDPEETARLVRRSSTSWAGSGQKVSSGAAGWAGQR